MMSPESDLAMAQFGVVITRVDLSCGAADITIRMSPTSAVGGDAVLRGPSPSPSTGEFAVDRSHRRFNASLADRLRSRSRATRVFRNEG